MTLNRFNTQSHLKVEGNGMKNDIHTVSLHSYVRGEHRVARGRLLYRDRQTEGAGAQSAVLHQRDPLQSETDTRSLIDVRTPEVAIKQKKCVGGCMKRVPAEGLNSQCSPQGSPEECSVWAGS